MLFIFIGTFVATLGFAWYAIRRRKNKRQERLVKHATIPSQNPVVFRRCAAILLDRIVEDDAVSELNWIPSGFSLTSKFDRAIARRQVQADYRNKHQCELSLDMVITASDIGQAMKNEGNDVLYVGLELDRYLKELADVQYGTPVPPSQHASEGSNDDIHESSQEAGETMESAIVAQASETKAEHPVDMNDSFYDAEVGEASSEDIDVSLDANESGKSEKGRVPLAQTQTDEHKQSHHHAEHELYHDAAKQMFASVPAEQGIRGKENPCTDTTFTIGHFIDCFVDPRIRKAKPLMRNPILGPSFYGNERPNFTHHVGELDVCHLL